MAERPEREHYESDPVIRSQDGTGQPFAAIVQRRLNRRDALKAGLGALIAGPLAAKVASSAGAGAKLGFTPIMGSKEDAIRVPAGYSHHIVLRWGDPIREGAPAFDLNDQTGEKQAVQFGYNNDFVGFLPLPFGSGSGRHGLLGVNHEYINPELMFPGFSRDQATAEQVEVMMAAVGFSVVEIELRDNEWRPVLGSRLNRRTTAKTPILISGPAKGHDWVRTNSDPDGVLVHGTFANCAAGRTPWGTVLTTEENFQSMFGENNPTDPRKKESNERYGIGERPSSYRWERHEPRFSGKNEPNEPFRFGWVVEIDPYDPDWTPRKRTSLGRFRHEAATTFVSKNDRVVLYSGDDARFEYVYKYVASQPYDRDNRENNREILDEGTLFVAKFNADGGGEWLPLIYGRGPLTEENGFENQGDVVINARKAADLLGATKMDRPEDIEVNPVNKKVYIALTNNTSREEADSANPRANNRHGHVIELHEEDDDHAALTFRWELFLVCGDPEDASTYFAGFPKDRVAPIANPDNVAFDQAGNLWISTDGMNYSMELNDGFFAVPTEGPQRGHVQQFMSSVEGSEVCGPEFTPDDRTVFLAIQHPGEGSRFEDPSTSWPQQDGEPPRPSVIAITKNDGGVIGS